MLFASRRSPIYQALLKHEYFIAILLLLWWVAFFFSFLLFFLFPYLVLAYFWRPEYFYFHGIVNIEKVHLLFFIINPVQIHRIKSNAIAFSKISLPKIFFYWYLRERKLFLLHFKCFIAKLILLTFLWLTIHIKY